MFGIITFSVLILMTNGLDFNNEPSNQELLQIIQTMNVTIGNLQNEMKQMKTHRSVGFFARLQSNDLTLGSHQTVEFNEVLTNVGGGYDSRHGHFTAPVAGMYQFIVTIMCVANHTVYIELVKNGSFVARVWAECLAFSASTTETALIVLNVGDMVWVRQGTGHTGELLHGNWCNFSGHLLL